METSKPNNIAVLERERYKRQIAAYLRKVPENRRKELEILIGDVEAATEGKPPEEAMLISFKMCCESLVNLQEAQVTLLKKVAGKSEN